MEAIIQTLFHFLGLIFWCIFPFLFLVKVSETGQGFSRLLSGICLAAGIGQFALSFHSLVNPFGLYYIFAPLGLITLGISFLFLSEVKLGLNSVLVSFFTTLGLVQYSLMSQSNYELVFWITKFLVFGVMSFAMVLGHYYLVVPRLSEKPLVQSHYITWLGLIVSSAIFSVSLASMNIDFGFKHLTDIIFLSMRSLWGYLAVGVISYFSYRLSKMRSTQSATGVLYVIVFFLIVGELMSMYFYVTKGALL